MLLGCKSAQFRQELAKKISKFLLRVNLKSAAAGYSWAQLWLLLPETARMVNQDEVTSSL